MIKVQLNVYIVQVRAERVLYHWMCLNSSIQYRQRLHFGLALIAKLAVSTLSEVKIIQILKNLGRWR